MPNLQLLYHTLAGSNDSTSFDASPQLHANSITASQTTGSYDSSKALIRTFKYSNMLKKIAFIMPDLSIETPKPSNNDQ